LTCCATQKNKKNVAGGIYTVFAGEPLSLCDAGLKCFTSVEGDPDGEREGERHGGIHETTAVLPEYPD